MEQQVKIENSRDLAELFANIERINHRLDKIESSHGVSAPPISSSPHASLDKFNIAEAIADSIFAGIEKEKACHYEPDKPCDHCSMCSSRGF